LEPDPFCSGYAGLGIEDLFEAGVHFIFLDEVAPVGLRDAFPHGGAETGVRFEKLQGGVVHQPRRAGSIIGGAVCVLIV